MPFEFDLGFLGGGQLARMSIQAAQRMGLRCLSLDSSTDTPAGQIAPSIVGWLDDSGKIAEIAHRCAHVTLENEFIPAEAIREAIPASDLHRLIPGVDSLQSIQDKLHQRQAMETAGVPSPRAIAIEGDGAAAIEAIGFPMVLKARFGGYDGKGTRYAKNRAEFESYRSLWGESGWLAESFVPFRRELAAMVWVESQTGLSGAFPTMETVQENHVCSLVFPSGTDASEIAIRAVKAVNGVGLYGVEMFELEDGSIQINELAPRPHNTGHYTLDWGGPSQFDVHVRLAMGYPVCGLLDNLALAPRPTCMANLLGQSGATEYEPALRRTLAEHPRARMHWYGKTEAKPGRKMGHLNIVANDTESLSDILAAAKSARAFFYESWTVTKQ
jgi:5-(carboxyamino)imidazole ribonucleotide synthase